MEQMRCPGCMNIKHSTPICEHCGFDDRQQNSTHQLPIGTVLKGQYIIGKVLGQGGFGITYLGWDNHLHIPLAIKEYYPTGMVMRDCGHSLMVTSCEGSDSTRFERERGRFLWEAQALAKLGNVPEVVRVMGYFPDNGTAYIIMEYIQGKTLKDYVRTQGKIRPEQILPMFSPIFRGLQKVHDAGLIHRDISPDNIMVLPNGRMKLLDFGAVRDYAGNATASTESILKHGYAPMEQYQRKGALGPWTDVYALCGTIYFCLTGEVPPDAPERMLYGEGFRWEDIEYLQPYQRAVLEKGTAVLVQDRLPSIESLRRGLSGEISDETPVTKPETAGKATAGREEKKPADPKFRKKHRGKVALVLMAAILAGAWLMNTKTPDEKQEQTVPQTETEATVQTQPVETTVETTVETEPETQPEPAKALRTENNGVVQYVADNVTVTSEYNRRLTVTLQGLEIPESYPVDMSKDEEYLYDWNVELRSGGEAIKTRTYYYIQIHSGWKGDITLADMNTYTYVLNGDYFYYAGSTSVNWDSQSITWKGNLQEILNDYNQYRDTKLDFDMAALDSIAVNVYDRETGQMQTWEYSVEDAENTETS